MKRPKVGISVILRDRDYILLGRRIGGHANGMWGCPGGHLEGGESFESCAIRETEEETGILLPSAFFLTVENTIFHIEQKHYVCIFMVANLPAGQYASVMEPNKCEAWLWFKWGYFPQPLMPGLYQMIDRNLTMPTER